MVIGTLQQGQNLQRELRKVLFTNLEINEINHKYTNHCMQIPLCSYFNYVHHEMMWL